jgi:tetratricopeptide (TPR) repeat protein
MIYLLMIVLMLLQPFSGEASVQITGSATLKKAMELVNSNKAAEAKTALAAYHPTDTELSSYHYAYAKAYELLGSHSDELTHLRLSYIYTLDGEMKERILVERAGAYLRMGYYPEAATCYRLFFRKYPQSRYHEEAHLGLADALYHQDYFVESILNYEDAGSSPMALFGKANAYQAVGRVEDAFNIYMPLTGKEREYLNSSEETLYNVAENFRLMGKPADAKIYYNSVKNPPFMFKADIGLGLIDMSEEKFDSAIAYFNAALQSPDRQLRSHALLRLAEAYERSGRQDDGKNSLLMIKNTYPYVKDYETALLRLSRILKKEGKFNDAVTLLRELASRRHPDKETIDEFEKIILDAKDGNGDEFIKLWNLFGRLVLDASRSEALMEIAKSLRPAGKPFLELCTWLSKNGLKPVKPAAYLALADFYADIGDTGRAQYYIGGVKGKSDDVSRIRAKIFREKKEYEKAIETVLALREITPNDIVFFSGLIENSKDIKKSVDFCEKALKQIGAPLKVYIKLADTLYKMGRNTDALKFYSIVASLKPENRKDLSPEDTGWTYYMVSKLSGANNTVSLPQAVQKENNIYSQSVQAVVKEAAILERMKRIN